MNSNPIIAVTCLSFEAQVAAGPGINVLCGTAQRYVDKLEAAVQAGGCGIISIGIAGGLATGHSPGDWVIAYGVVAEGVRIPTDARWSKRLLEALPKAVYADISGVDAPVVRQSDKQALHEAAGTVAVDMESHIAAKIAARHSVPFAACRVIIDPAERTLPPAALVGMRADGRPDVFAVIRSLCQQPRQVLSLLRVVADAHAARSALFRGRRRLGDNLSFPGVAELQLNPSV
ncbi:MAG: phosphorylase [Alphaproteobacteria bacterium]|nr:phosphorylase [Alphaproteobacteria bacterium]